MITIMLTLIFITIFIKYNNQLLINANQQMEFINQKYINYSKGSINLGALQYTNNRIICIRTIFFNDLYDNSLMDYHNFLIDVANPDYIEYLNTSNKNDIKSYVDFYGDCKFDYSIVSNNKKLKNYLSTLFSYLSKTNKLNIHHFTITKTSNHQNNKPVESFNLIYHYDIINDDYYYLYSFNNKLNESITDNYIVTVQYISIGYDSDNILKEDYYRIDNDVPIQMIMYKQKINLY